MIVADTYAWLWWTSAPDRLSPTARALLEQAEAVGVCTISAWEVAMLAARGRITLDRDVRLWVRLALAQPSVSAVQLTADVAVAAGLLDRDGFPGDPADRIIYATASSLGAPLVTRDAALRAFDPARTRW